MSFCTHCGNQISDGALFCPVCGVPAGSAARPPYKPLYEMGDPEDVRENGTLSLFCYLSILLIIPIILKPNSDFVKFHTNQGLVLILFSIIANLCFIVPFLGWAVGAIADVFAIVCIIIGIVNACRGMKKPLPLIGKYQIYKY